MLLREGWALLAQVDSHTPSRTGSWRTNQPRIASCALLCIQFVARLYTPTDRCLNWGICTLLLLTCRAYLAESCIKTYMICCFCQLCCAAFVPAGFIYRLVCAALTIGSSVQYSCTQGLFVANWAPAQRFGSLDYLWSRLSACLHLCLCSCDAAIVRPGQI